MNKKIVLLTGCELRHEFFRKYLSTRDNIEVLATFCESKKGNITEVIDKDNKPKALRHLHLASRDVTEKDFFELYCKNTEDVSNPNFIEKGDINKEQHVENIIKLNPDLIISYGCSIIRSELLNVFANRFINIHLGLSPYYRGSGTNFWPFVNNELQFVGTTFMHIDAGVDTGEIIHQIRAKIDYSDNIHQIGNRLIKDSFVECTKLIESFDKLVKLEQPDGNNDVDRYYRKKDFSENSLRVAYKNISDGIIKTYLQNKNEIDKQYPILKNPAI